MNQTKKNNRPLRRLAMVLGAIAALTSAAALADDWTMWGRTPTRDMVTPEKDPPTDWRVPSTDDPKGLNILWTASLGSKSYGNPVVVDGIVYVGTNNEGKRDPTLTADGGVLMAFNKNTGKFLWQRYSAKLPTGRVNDWPGEGLCSTVYIDAGHLWYCTNRCEVVCLEISPGAMNNGLPREAWSYDMIGKLGVFPHNMTSSSIAAWGDYIYAITSNGVDDTHKHVVAPLAPSIVCLNKNTGQLVWSNNTPGANVLHGQWASVAITEVNGRPLVIAPLGDAWVYAFDARTGEIVWKFDSNPKDAIYPQTRNELIATPVIVGNYMYIANGQDPEHGEGYGWLWCVDITKTGDVSAELDSNPNAPAPTPGQELLTSSGNVPTRKGIPNPNSAVVWSYNQYDLNHNGKIEREEHMNRSISACCVVDDLVFAPDFSGFLHCLDAKTGQVYWTYDMESAVWGSPMAADGKIYLADEDGDVRIFAISKEMKKLSPDDDHLNLGSASYCSPVFSDGVLYLTDRERLFAIKTGAGEQPVTSDALNSRAHQAAEQLDAHVRQIVQWHFNPQTGCPFWLEKAANLSWDPRKEIRGYADLQKFDHFQDDWLRGGPVRRWVPKGLAGRPVYVFETGGSTGVPKSRIQIDDFRTDYELFSKTLSDTGFPPGADWLMLGPSGPRRLRLAVEHLAQLRGGGISFCVDLDPRWVIKLIKRGDINQANLYKQHCVDQALTILRSQGNIRCMFTTPKLLEALAEKIDLAHYGIKGIFCGGTELTPQFHRFAREELIPGIDFVPTYGNTLMGLATHKPFDPADNYEIIYHAPQPRAVLEIVEPTDAGKKVEYGKWGRVMLTTLTKETFIPRFLERDEAIRRPPCAPYPWDGAGNVRPFSGLAGAASVVEGVY